tara:strand:+ start:331 stop:687 length:357 start_codon:yes stop_codon:yes gene_type:complete
MEEEYNSSPMRKWWELHKKVYIFPRDWNGELSKVGDFMIQNHKKGILVITENTDIKNHIKMIFDDIPPTVGGVCAGDWILYDTPLASIEEDEVLWWVTPGDYPDPDEFMEFRFSTTFQ